mmetsp:Transcript_81021/g.227212  ORF Transcript_81021/g.227212 Transcript_81021/m.227212 type:complete len:90 (-) Transcript_81021:746-1015(-)
MMILCWNDTNKMKWMNCCKHWRHDKNISKKMMEKYCYHPRDVDNGRNISSFSTIPPFWNRPKLGFDENGTTTEKKWRQHPSNSILPPNE